MDADPAKPRKPSYLPDILLGILPLLLGAQLLAWLSFFPQALRGHADFRQLYIAGYMIRTGHAHELYDYTAQTRLQDELVYSDDLALPFIRPAYQALLFVPLSLLWYRTAYLAFLGVNLVLLGISFWLLRSRMRNIATAWRGLPVALFLVFYPVTLALMQGQDSILLLALLAAALVSLDRDRELVAGVLVGLGLFKLQIVIPIALLFLAWRRWRFSAGFALSAIMMGIISLGVVGFGETLGFVRSLFSVGTGLASQSGQLSFPLRVSIMANLRGLISGVAGAHLSASWLQGITILVSLIVLVWVAVSTPRKLAGADALLLAITTSVVVSYYLFIHDLSVLLIPMVLTLDRFMKPGGSKAILGHLTGGAAALLLMAPMCLFLIPGHFYLVSLPLCAFLFLLIRSVRGDAASSVTETGPPKLASEFRGI